jgi:hypothetical protein
MRTAVVLLVLSGTTIPALATQPDYFPLQVGNQWVYRQGGVGAGEPVVVEIVESRISQDKVYYLFRGRPLGEAWLRMEEDGTLYAYDPDLRSEKVWVRFGEAEGATYETAMDECSPKARIDSKTAQYRGPIGEFETALHIGYPPAGCADAGITEEFYLPYVGLVQRTWSSIAGPRTFDLIYARLGGVTVVSGPETSFSLALDRNRYEIKGIQPPAATMIARLTLRNTQQDPVELTWPDGQRYDLEIRNEKGEAVYRWSEGRAFPLFFSRELFSGERNYVIQAPTPLSPGRYTAEAWFTTLPRQYSATVSFQVAVLP